jgi:hypothetical protein
VTRNSKLLLGLAFILIGVWASAPLQAKNAARFQIIEGNTNAIQVGYIDVAGKIVIPLTSNWWPSFAQPLRSFAEGLEPVHFRFKTWRTNGDWGYIDPQGKTAIAPQFSLAQPFSEGLAAARDPATGKSGYVDKTGAMVIPPKFSLAWPFSAGVGRVEMAGKMIYINKKGQPIFTVTNGFWADEFSEGLANVSLRTNRGADLWGYMNRKGEFVFPPQFQRAEPFYHGLASVFRDGHFGYIDHAGKWVWQGKKSPFFPADEK